MASGGGNGGHSLEVFPEPEPEPSGARPLGRPPARPSEAESCVVDLNYFPHGPHSYPRVCARWRALPGSALSGHRGILVW